MSALLVGYARCSTDQQDLTAQRDGLLGLGVEAERIYVDHGLTGTNRARPGLREAMAATGVMSWPRVRTLVRQILDAASALHATGGFIAGVNPDMIRLTGEGDAERALLTTAGIRSVQDVLATMRAGGGGTGGPAANPQGVIAIDGEKTTAT